MKVKFRSAGVVVVRQDKDGWRFLVLRCYRNWDFPKGLMEPGEDSLQAAIRETEEETSIADLVFHWGLDYRETEPYGAGKVARFYVAEMQQRNLVLPVSPSLGKPEHDEYRWVTAEGAMGLLPPRLGKILEWAVTKVGAKG